MAVQTKKPKCPKCGSSHTWKELDNGLVYLRCMCGLTNIIENRLEQIEIKSKPLNVKLPRKESKLFRTLINLKAIEPANTQRVANILAQQGYNYTTSLVAAYLYMLETKGLVVILENGKTKKGGSTWGLTPQALKLLGD